MSARRARNQAESLIRRLGIYRPPVQVDYVAQQLGLPIIRMNLGPDVSGLLVSNRQQTCIAVQDTHPHNRQRFTIAHEIAHFYLGHQFEAGEHVHVDRGNYISQRNPRSSSGLDPKEVEANQFAAALLMPTDLVLQAVNEMGVHHLLDWHVSELAETFEVSEQAMTIRLTSLGLL